MARGQLPKKGKQTRKTWSPHHIVPGASSRKARGGCSRKVKLSREEREQSSVQGKAEAKWGSLVSRGCVTSRPVPTEELATQGEQRLVQSKAGA